VQFDPESGEYLLVRQHDSWLSVDPVLGCPRHCQYCILRIDDLTRKRPRMVASTRDAVGAIARHPYFVPSKTVVSYGNNTDAFIQVNTSHTLKFLREFRSQGYDNPVAIATKAGIDARLARLIRRVGGRRTIIFLSYSGLDPAMEQGVSHDRLQRSFPALRDAEVTICHFWRPLLAANGSAEKIREVLRLVSRYATSSVCIGLKFGPRLYELFHDTPELLLPSALEGTRGNYLQSSITKRVLRIAHSEFPEYRVYFRTSCAVAHALEATDYTATLGTDACEASLCPLAQRARCARSRRLPSSAAVHHALAKVAPARKFAIESQAVWIDGELSQEQYIFLLHTLRYPIRARVGVRGEWQGHILPRQQPSETAQ